MVGGGPECNNNKHIFGLPFRFSLEFFFVALCELIKTKQTFRSFFIYIGRNDHSGMNEQMIATSFRFDILHRL